MPDTVKSLHREAMALADRAMYGRREGDGYRRWYPAVTEDEARELFRQAWEKETAAIALLPEGPQSEPTRGILERSAACLAKDAGIEQEAREESGR